MRKIKFLSPTSIDKFYSDPDEYYLRYLADNRPPKIKQTEPMSVGAAFDAFVKSYLHENLFGHDGNGEFNLRKMFEDQVEPHNRDFAKTAGMLCFKAYKKSGALADLLDEMNKAQTKPRMEFSVKGTIDGVPLLGKPDIYFINKDGVGLIKDFKVNGYCSNNPPSPVKFYKMLRDGWDGPPSRNANKPHKGFVEATYKGIKIHKGDYMNDVAPKWALQLSIYAWLMGAEVGGDFVAGIEQLVCNKKKQEIRIANHAMQICPSYQEDLIEKAKWVWEVVNSDHIFRDLSYEESLKRQEWLDGYHEVWENLSPLSKMWREDR